MAAEEVIGLLGGFNPARIIITSALRNILGGGGNGVPGVGTASGGPLYGPYVSPGTFRGATAGVGMPTGGTTQGVDLGGGYVLTDRGIMTPDGTIISTPPLVPGTTSPTNPEQGGSSASNGGGGGGGGNEADNGGYVTLEPGLGPDLGGLVGPEFTGYMPDPTDPYNKPPVPETVPPTPPATTPTTTKPTTDEGWIEVAIDWLKRFPNTTEEERRQAAKQAGMPDSVVDQVLKTGTGGTGTGTGTGNDTGTGTDNGSGNGTSGATGTLPLPTPTTRPNTSTTGDPGKPTGTSETGTGTGGTGTSPGAGAGGGVGSFGSPTRTSDTLFGGELFHFKSKITGPLDNLLKGYYY